MVTRIPLVAGVGGGVGTSTMAAAVRGQDRGIYRPGDLVDVLVARASMVSLRAAQRALATCPEPRPVLVVVADQARGRLPDNAAHRLRMSEAYTAEIVHVPYVEAWRHLDQPIASAFHALTGGLTRQIPSRAARGFADTTDRLVRALTVRLDPAAPQPSTHGVAAGVAAGVAGGVADSVAAGVAAAAARTVTAGRGAPPVAGVGSHRPATPAALAPEGPPQRLQPQQPARRR